MTSLELVETMVQAGCCPTYNVTETELQSCFGYLVC